MINVTKKKLNRVKKWRDVLERSLKCCSSEEDLEKALQKAQRRPGLNPGKDYTRQWEQQVLESVWSKCSEQEKSRRENSEDSMVAM